MLRRFIAVHVVLVPLIFALPAYSQNVAGPAKAKATTPEIPFDSVPNFFKMPAGLYMGEGTGIATNSKGHVFVFTRSGETRLFEFDQNGTFVKEFGVGATGLRSLTRSAWTRTTTCGRSTKAPTSFRNSLRTAGC